MRGDAGWRWENRLGRVLVAWRGPSGGGQSGPCEGEEATSRRRMVEGIAQSGSAEIAAAGGRCRECAREQTREISLVSPALDGRLRAGCGHTPELGASALGRRPESRQSLALVICFRWDLYTVPISSLHATGSSPPPSLLSLLPPCRSASLNRYGRGSITLPPSRRPVVRTPCTASSDVTHTSSSPVSLQQMVLFGQNPSQGTLLRGSQFLLGASRHPTMTHLVL